MKPIKLLLAAALALVALSGLALALALWQPTPAKAGNAAEVSTIRGLAGPSSPLEWEDGWYFKDVYTDYAPSGVPDFDQRQDSWGLGSSPGAPDWHWTHCGPVAVANSLWWFDSKFEPNPQGPPPGGPIPPNDNYPLLTSYGSWDDHDPQNVEPFVNQLASYLGTNTTVTGTNVYSLAAGLQQYIADRGLANRYYVSMRGEGRWPELMPWVYEEVLKSEDVILLLGFYEQQGAEWIRIGGHFVTVVGITQTMGGIGVALSDPTQDWAEPPSMGWGRVRNGLLVPHPLPHTGVYTVHNDAGNVSHDFYVALPGSASPGGEWWFPDYQPTPDLMMNFQGVNPHPDPIIPTGPYLGGLIHTEIEYAVAVSPMFWKAAYDDYAPSGIPDFDMRQDEWGYTDTLETWHWTHDGPTAWANSFWWFDAKFNDEITRSAIVEYDHVSTTVPLLINDLATYANTNQSISGTSPISLSHGIDRYLKERGLQNVFYRTTYERPPFRWVVHEVEKSEDVLLLIGFWQEDPAGAGWQRLGGHWVTVAGINGRDGTIAFSDPYINWAEEPPGQGRVLPLFDHPYHSGDYTLHNDALYVSHDVWVVTDTHSPGGTWGPLYYADTVNWANFAGLNPHPLYPFGEDSGLPVVAEVEYAVAVSPMEMFWKGDEGYEDYAPNGIPDFDQHQDLWGWNPAVWTYCGPVAAANSLWWFDSKFEPDPQTPQPGVPNDHFPLVSAYQPGIDDHDPANVGGGPPGIPPAQPGLVEELASLMDTDGQRTASPHQGTKATDMEWGISAYLQKYGMADQFYTKTVQMPTFEYVCDQVELSEDVVLLIGFWEYQGNGLWRRYGGHYVTVAGVDRTFRHVAFSDPALDAAENLWSGRVLSGTLLPHYPPHPTISDPTIHNDAGNISHDIYQVITTTSPGGVWGPVEYSSKFPLSRFENQNDGWLDDVPGDEGELGVVVAEVEYAFVVSPLPPDVTIHKEVTPTLVVPGDWVTFTLVYTNVAANWAENVVISDLLPSELVNPQWTYATTYGKSITAYDTYTWTVGRLAYMEGGVITVTAQVASTITDPQRIITNTVGITTTTAERTPELPNRDFATITVQTADLGIAKTVAPSGTVGIGDWVTFTLVYTNAGPATASNVFITDVVPSNFTNVGYTASGAVINPTGTISYTWQVADLLPGEGGVITITAQVSSTAGGSVTNEALIAGWPDRNASNDQAEVTVEMGAIVYLPLVLRDY
jgi:uncharacterized repeat protein (TIGR01451 family)